MEFLLEAVNSPKAPQPIGPYVQAIKTEDYLFCSGQIPIDPLTGEMKNASVEQEARQVLANLRAVLEEAGLTWANVVRTSIYMTDLKDFGLVNSIYEEALGTARPARSTIQVAGLPKGARVEIDCIAAR